MNVLAKPKTKFLLIGIVALNVLPHILILPVWLTILSLSMIAWAFMHLRIGIRLPSAALKWTLCLGGTLGIWYEFSTKLIQDAACALLVYMAVLKLFESTRVRDARLIVFICYFLLMAFLLNDQSLFSTLFMAFDVLMITSLLFHLNHNEAGIQLRSLRPVLKLLVLSLPIWIFLFVVFPRFSAQILGDPRSETMNSSGFSDSLNPGDVESLIESDELAFRAQILSRSTAMNTDQLYWRGGVLEQSDGLKWRKEPATPVASRDSSSSDHESLDNNDIVEYTVTREPSLNRWMFALDHPLEINLNSQPQKQPGITSTRDKSFQFSEDHPYRTMYSGRSRLTPTKHQLSTQEREMNLQVPQNLSQKVVDVAKALKPEPGMPLNAELVFQKIDQYYEQNHFQYSLRPGLMSGDPMETFLLKKKVGFCEHFAATSALLARLAGIPARVVIGYQGGQYNRVGTYWMIRNLDAHAWTEYYSDQKQAWIRYDAVAGIAPERLRMGGDFNRRFDGINASWLHRTNGTPLWMNRWADRISLTIDALSVRYQQFLLQYDFEYQQKLLRELGIRDFAAFTLFAALAIGLFISAFIIAAFLKKSRIKRDPLLKPLQKLSIRLEALNIEPRRPTEGPKDFLNRVEPLLAPKSQIMFREIMNEFILLRYGSPSSENPWASAPLSLPKWRAKTLRFKPRSKSDDTCQRFQI